MIISKLAGKNIDSTRFVFWIPILLTIAVIALMPTQAYAIEFPAITGISPNDDPITVGIKLAALIFKAIIFVIFVAAFVAAAYVAVTTLFKMVNDRENAGEQVGKLAFSLFVIVVVWWFADQGEDAADDLQDVQLSYVETYNAIVQT